MDNFPDQNFFPTSHELLIMSSCPYLALSTSLAVQNESTDSFHSYASFIRKRPVLFVYANASKATGIPFDSLHIYLQNALPLCHALRRPLTWFVPIACAVQIENVLAWHNCLTCPNQKSVVVLCGWFGLVDCFWLYTWMPLGKSQYRTALFWTSPTSSGNDFVEWIWYSILGLRGDKHQKIIPGKNGKRFLWSKKVACDSDVLEQKL